MDRVSDKELEQAVSDFSLLCHRTGYPWHDILLRALIELRERREADAASETTLDFAKRDEEDAENFIPTRWWAKEDEDKP